jgi:double-stranded uracil-DNA glycosylase
MPLRDVRVERARILFVGINPGLRSEQLGHHFAGPGNPFWRLLHAAGVTPVLLHPSEDARLAEWRIGLTNLCSRASRSAAELDRTELETGRAELLAKIELLRPEVVALVGITLYRQVFPKPTGNPGPGPKPERIGGARLFVVPNPSGLNAAYPSFQSKLIWFEELARFATPPRETRPRSRGRASATPPRPRR